MPGVVVAAFYKFVALPPLQPLQAAVEELCEVERLTGIILLAKEGINATVAGSQAGIHALLKFLRAVPQFEDLQVKHSTCEQPPFHRMKVRLKKEIVTLGDASIAPTERVGTYVPPERWNEVLDDPQVVVIDTRNTYETRLGTFRGALDPQLASFSDFPGWARHNLDPNLHPKVAMYCTGGIRCEKASSLLLREGFSEVLHLEGGILNYLEKVPEAHSRWQGECFVFDQRVALDHKLAPGRHQLCYGCQEPVSPEDVTSPLYEAGVCCPRCHDSLDQSTRAGRRERVKQVALAKARGARHIGDLA